VAATVVTGRRRAAAGRDTPWDSTREAGECYAGPCNFVPP
jgi:hypothetical protein